MKLEQVAELLRQTIIQINRLEKKITAIEDALVASSVLYFVKSDKEDA